jgi:hypothetical protein
LAIAQDKDLPQETMERLQKLYPQQSEDFLKVRMKNAKGAFSKWRSFPPYYYEMLKRSKVAKPLMERPGLCAGDPHIENFGFIPDSSNTTLFTLNDLDDSTQCSLDTDLMRLFIAHRFISPKISAESFLKTYVDGLKGADCFAPALIKNLEVDSLKKGRSLSKKSKALLDSRVCHGEYADLTSLEKEALADFVAKDKTSELIHGCSRTKDTGGSAGEKRFVVFQKSSQGVISAFELKPLVKSAPDFDQEISVKKREEIFTQVVRTFLKSDLKDHYYPVTLQKRLYQRRPIWAGLADVNQEDLDQLDGSAKQEVMLFETCQLGRLHGKTNPTQPSISALRWEEMARSLESQFRMEFAESPQK